MPPFFSLIVTHKFRLDMADVGHTTNSGQPLKTRQVLRCPSLEKRGNGEIFDSTEKPLGMLRRADTSTSSVERKILNVINPLPVRPQALEG